MTGEVGLDFVRGMMLEDRASRRRYRMRSTLRCYPPALSLSALHPVHLQPSSTPLSRIMVKMRNEGLRVGSYLLIFSPLPRSFLVQSIVKSFDRRHTSPFWNRESYICFWRTQSSQWTDLSTTSVLWLRQCGGISNIYSQ